MKRRPRPADQPLTARKLREAGLILPGLGLLALMPPAATILAVDGTILGVPVVVAYVFAIWLGLILGARWLSRRLLATDQDRTEHG